MIRNVVKADSEVQELKMHKVTYEEEQYKAWKEDYSDYVTWEIFKENFSKCPYCSYWSDEQCICYAR